MLNEPMVIEAFDGYAAAVRYSPDGVTAVTAGASGGIRIWMVPTWQPAVSLAGHEKTVNSLSLGPGGRRLLSGSSDGSARLWSLVPPEEPLLVFTHGKTVAGVSLSPDERLAATASYDATVRLWRTDDGEEVARFSPAKGNKVTVAFSPDGRLLAGGGLGSELYLWDVEKGEETARAGGHDAAVAATAFGPDGARLASTDVSHLRLLTVPDLEPVWVAPLPEPGVHPLALAPSGAVIAVGGDHRVWIYDSENGDLLAERSVEPKGVYGVDFAPDMSHLAVACADGRIRVYPLDPPG